ncbi:tubulin-specific chaperone E-like [Artemia franciscana]|uniref:Tubulin-specific chaperone E n=1 Tax=Artemia franciscana TaxID=6661 RepID=A0AA88HKV5_ARTSF|nr:hypothetical protein QYM36_013223 [Artemia franciscana]
MDYFIGCRVLSFESKGTVKYIGKVDSQPGIWLGIDWDTPERGKHDGTYKGIKYFTTRYPTSGSFIKPDKVSRGTSLVQALKNRYLKFEETHIEEQNLMVLQKTFNAPFVEIVGMDKVSRTQCNLGELKEASVSSQPVSHGGNGFESLFPNLEELHLDSTLLSAWTDVFEIINHLPKLKMLNLSYNVLSLDNIDESGAVFPNIRHLVLIGMEYTWTDIRKICKFFPDVEHLQVSWNKITSIDSIDCIDSCRILDLEHNSLKFWKNLRQLGRLKRLQRLNLIRSELENIEIDGGDFPSLQVLWLTKNDIKEWHHISQLGKIYTLKDLRILENPLLKKANMETNRQNVIARIGSLKVLNGTEISSQDRKGAEIDYVKSLAQEWRSVRTDSARHQKFLEDHPRFEVLAKALGLPEKEELEKMPTTVKSSLIGIKITLSEDKMVLRKVPSTMSVGKLRSLVERLTNSDEDISLFAASEKRPNVLIPLDNEMRQLSFYSIEDGDYIHVK